MIMSTQRRINNMRQRRRRRLLAVGEWQSPYVDAGPVRAHVKALQDAGMAQAAVERRLGLVQGGLKNLMFGANGRPPGQFIRRETADAVLAFWPTLQDFPDTASIDPTGTLRRVQALETLGWSRPRLAADLGMAASNFKMTLRNPRVSARFARKVAALYDRLWTQRPEDHGVVPYVADRVRRNAQARSFYGPLAWDDETIDDPQAEPMTDVSEPVTTEGENVAARWLMGESVILNHEHRREVLAHLFEWTNDTPEQIADRLEMTPDAASRAWERMKDKARMEGRRLYRRAYIPRERDLSRNEMGAAA